VSAREVIDHWRHNRADHIQRAPAGQLSLHDSATEA
jgi:hypothetical protein